MGKLIFSKLILGEIRGFFCIKISVFTLLFSLFCNQALAIEYQYLEVPEPGIVYSLQSMRAHGVQMTNFMNYTMNMDTPGFVEIGVYNVRTNEGEIIPAPFYRWRVGAPVESNRELDFYCDSSCIDHESWQDDQLIEDCDGHDDWYDTAVNNSCWAETNSGE